MSPMTLPTVLVTGISGFIAKHCALELLRGGYGVRGTVRQMAKAEETRTTLARHTDVSRLSFVEADLLAERGWSQAVQGVGAVLHLASPFPLQDPKDPDELIRPAVDGTMRVLRHAVAAGVPRFVQTSSIAAIVGGLRGRGRIRANENDWTNLDDPGVSAYFRSKTLAERAARDFVANTAPQLHYTSINPGFVLGPALDRDVGTSADFIRLILRGKYPGMPRIWIGVVDVRDVARMHRLALERDLPSGGRWMGVSEVVRFLDIALVLREQLDEQAARAPTRELPDWLVRLVGLFDPAVRGLLPDLGFRFTLDNHHTREALGMDFIPMSESAPALARSLYELKMV